MSEKHAGETNEENLALACVFCNRAKGTDIAARATRTGIISRLFNPRLDHWAEHFRLDGEFITPLSDIADATVSLLKLNDPDRLLERRVLILDERYPSEPARKRIKT